MSHDHGMQGTIQDSSTGVLLAQTLPAAHPWRLALQQLKSRLVSKILMGVTFFDYFKLKVPVAVPLLRLKHDAKKHVARKNF